MYDKQFLEIFNLYLDRENRNVQKMNIRRYELDICLILDPQRTLSILILYCTLNPKFVDLGLTQSSLDSIP
jgi:hypothetical protein